MSEQREDADPAHIATRAILHAKHGGLMSGGRIRDFEKGWALIGLNHGKAHSASVQDSFIVTLCGLAWDEGVMIFAPGNWTRCKRCEKA